MTYAPDPRPQALVKANAGKAAGLSAGAMAIMVAFIAAHEGEVRHTYVDKLGAGKPLTYCYGSTVDPVPGKAYTHEECLAALMRDAKSHAAFVAPHLPPNTPDRTAAMIGDFGYNLGETKFVKTSVARKARAGDLAGACRAIGLYVFTGGKDCRVKANRCGGVVRRRADAVELCLKGLTP